MATRPPLGPRKRSGPALCGAGWPRGSAPAAALGNGFPPSKRPKGPAEVGAEEDPFGDNDDFTADDLEEIDTIASQALSQDAAGRGPAPASRPHGAWSGAAEPGAGGGADGAQLRGAFQLQVLQAQHEDARRKLKEMQDEILTKNGEIKMLRDSMQQMEHTMDEQRRSYMLLEQQQSQALGEKEREFSKKLLSLQSELQFKDAEMNELRTRLQNCERNKHSAQTVVPQSSPKKNFTVQMKSEGCPLQPGKRSFPTKESFNAETAVRPSSSSSGNCFAQMVSSKEDSKMPHPELSSIKQEAMGRNGSCNSVPRRNIQEDGKATPKAISPGSALLSALLKQPLVSGSLLGLCHLLSSSAEALPGAVLQPDLLQTQPTQMPGTRAAPEEVAPLVSLQEAQKLAVTGLNLIAMDEGPCEGSPAGSGSEVLCLKRCKIPGAVHLLPLVEHHIGAYCRAVQSADKSVNASCGNHAVVSSRTNTSKVASKEDFRLSLEEATVLSLGILYYLAFYSWDVVHVLLANEVEESSAVGEEQLSKTDRNVLCDNKDDRTQGGLPDAPQDADSNIQAQHSLFRKLLQVLAVSATAGSQMDCILQHSLKVLVKLAENSTMDLLINFQHLLSHQVLLRVLCPAVPLHTVLLTVKLLSILAQHHLLVAQLCSHSDSCLLLALYMYITSRPDKSASEVHWLQLEQEAVRLLTRCVRFSSPTVLPPAAHCQCNLEVVKALIIMLHRQWTKIRRFESSLCAHKEQVIQFLRDAVLLLHSLSQKDKLFHEHCLEVLHQYDQAMPGIRAILRKTKKLSACEELILDELYPPEPEAEDQDSS
ncbi:ATR-interacting protein isoform X1 [Lagopus muta]|uniref:ATR-interacting protein isoform X1 n=1 Tax=Lagopus muta TaxID=64668 RepID=UPI0020A20EDD|nr:ATR-interacting protein isoform X1 [Lagopus muta]